MTQTSNLKETGVARSGRNLELVGTRQTTQEVETHWREEVTKKDLLWEKEQELIKREDDVKTTIAAVKTLVSALSQRVLTMTALVAGIAAFGWSVFDPNAVRITAAVLYACLVFLPLAVIDARRS